MGSLTIAVRRGALLLVVVLSFNYNNVLVLGKHNDGGSPGEVNRTIDCLSTACDCVHQENSVGGKNFLAAEEDENILVGTSWKHRSLSRSIEVGDQVCGDGKVGVIPNQGSGQIFDIEDQDSSDWGNLGFPSVLEINKFNSESYYRGLAFGNLDAADRIFKNDNVFFLVPLAESGAFARHRSLQRSGDKLLGLTFANWDCTTETLTVLVHAIPGFFINELSIQNFVLADATQLLPTDQQNFIRDSDNSAVGFELHLVVPCDSCIDFEISALINGTVASSGKQPQLDLALPCCVVPSTNPSSTPSNVPSALPSEQPSIQPSIPPSISNVPSRLPSVVPSISVSPSGRPSNSPSAKPSQQPSISSIPSLAPIPPTAFPTASAKPSATPTTNPSATPTASPSVIPSVSATESPSLFPTPNFLQACSAWHAPEFYPYRVEKWSGQQIKASDEDQCCPEKTIHYNSMYGDSPLNDGAANAQISIAADRSYTLYVNGVEIGSGRDWQHSQTFMVRLMPSDVVAVEALDNGDVSGLVVEINFIHGGRLYTSKSWKASSTKSYGWNTRHFDDSSWKQATSYGRVNDSQPWRSYGYTNGLSRKSLAEWIWLQQNPTRAAYFRFAIPAELSFGGYITMAADDEFDLYLNGEMLGSGNDWQETKQFSASFKRGDVISVRCRKGNQVGGLAAEISLNNGELIFSSNAWKTASGLESGWYEVTFDDSLWDNAVEYGVVNVAEPWVYFGEVKGFHAGTQTPWIWTQSPEDSDAFFRYVIPDILPMGTEVVIAADSLYTIYLNGRLIGNGNNWQESDVYTMSLLKDDVVGLEAVSGAERGGLVAEINLLNGEQQFSTGSWKATSEFYEGWNRRGFDSYDWPAALDRGPITAYPWNNRVQGLIGTDAHWIWARAKQSQNSQNDSESAYLRIVPIPGTYPSDGNDICDRWTFDGDDSYLRNDGNLLNTAAYTGGYSEKILPLYDPLDDAVCFNQDYNVRNYNLNEMMALYQKYQRAFDRELSNFSEYTEEYNRVTHNRLPGMMLRMCFHDNSVHSYEPKFQDYVAANLDRESGRWNGPFKYLETSGGDASNLICSEERHHPNNDHDQSASRVLQSIQEYIKYDGYEALSYADLLHNGCKAALIYLTGYDPISYLQSDPFYFGRKDACHVDVKCPSRKYELCGCSELLPGVPLTGPDYNAWFKDRGMSECLWMSLMWSHTTVDSMASMCPIRKMSCLARENDVRAFGDKSRLYFEAGDYLDYYDFFLERGEHTTVEYTGPGKNREKTCEWRVEGEYVPWPLTEVDCTLTLDNVKRAGLDDLASAIVNLHRPGYNAVHIFGCALNMFSGSGYHEGGICTEIGPIECRAPQKHLFGSFFE